MNLAVSLCEIGIKYQTFYSLSNTCETLEEYAEWLGFTFEGEKALALFVGYLEKIKEKNTAIMCAELNHIKCHRKIIADELIVLGYEVKHL